MKKLVLSFMLLMALGGVAFADVYTYGGNPCQNSDGTLLSASGVTAGNAVTKIISGTASKQIFICGLQVQNVSGTNPTFTLVQGTGTNCATGSTAITPAFITTANTMNVFTSPVHKVSQSQDLCYLTGGTTPVTNFLMTYIVQ